MKFFTYFFFICLFTVGCKKNSSNPKLNLQSKSFEYITKLSWNESKDTIWIESAEESVYFLKSELPLKTAMVVPTSVLAYLDELNLNEIVIGISQPDFVYNPKILKNYEENKIQQIGSFDELFLERIILAKPDVVFSTTSPSLARFHEQLKNQGIKIIYIDEYEELEPLAKAEYVKIFGRLFGKEAESKAIFKEIKENYMNLKNQMGLLTKRKPTVLANQMYGDVWYMPAGNSFQAKLIQDAGGEYLWKDTPGHSTLQLSFETVFEKAVMADVWINAGDFPDKKALVASYKNYEWLKPYKEGQIYNWYKRTTPKGANDYFESGTARPDWVLQDLAAIFHPDLFPGHELFFYEKLE